MEEPRSRTVQCWSPAGMHKMVCKEWGDPRNRKVLVCVHGVTRVSDDFDALAMAMSDRYRVICPDVVGRGRSDWLTDPRHYHLPQYISDMKKLLAEADAEQVAWVGTSMGGLIGMGMACGPFSPISRLVLNDVGPNLNFSAMSRIGSYIGEAVEFPSFQQGLDYIRSISASFGPHTEEQWHKLTADVLRQSKDRQWRRHYDLRLAEPFKSFNADQGEQIQAALWAAYDAILCPVLLLRGAESDLLTRETAEEMARRGPRARLVEFPGVGHAPTLVHADQISAVREFLLQ